MDKTESYIVLKPIAERFSRIASEMTDDEIKTIIQSEMREQLRRVDFGNQFAMIVDEWFEDPDNVDMIIDTLSKSVKDKCR